MHPGPQRGLISFWKSVCSIRYHIHRHKRQSNAYEQRLLKLLEQQLLVGRYQVIVDAVLHSDAGGYGDRHWSMTMLAEL